MSNHKKIIIITPSFPFPPSGAEQSDRASGITIFKNLGYDVSVISKLVSWQSLEFVKEMEKKMRVKIITVPYKYSNRNQTFKEKIKKNLLKLVNPLLFDGAALEYAEPEIVKVVKEEVSQWKPDFIWCEYTYLWPLYKIGKKAKIPIITRSINFEPIHFLQEDGYGLINLLKSLPKFLSEFIVTRKSDHIFSITPKEEKIYRMMGAKSVTTLPLRGLSSCLKKNHPIRDKKTMNVFFMGSTYNVSHNKRALEFILKEIAPFMSKNYPNQFAFYILGKKVPENYNSCFTNDVIYKGPVYGEELEKFLTEMDIAIIPSFFGAGMQQKIFEPIARGIPTITSSRGIADYPFKDRIHVYFANSKTDYINCLLELKDQNKREKLSKESIKLASALFSQKTIDQIMQSVINKL